MYKCINGWTKDDMIAHILAEFNGRSVKDEEICVYRGPNGTKCAVGMFIPDSEYKTEFDPDSEYKTEFDEVYGISAWGLLTDNPNLASNMPLSAVGMGCLQASHDRPTLDNEEVAKTDENTLHSILEWIDENVGG